MVKMVKMAKKNGEVFGENGEENVEFLYENTEHPAWYLATTVDEGKKRYVGETVKGGPKRAEGHRQTKKAQLEDVAKFYKTSWDGFRKEEDDPLARTRRSARGGKDGNVPLLQVPPQFSMYLEEGHRRILASSMYLEEGNHCFTPGRH